MSKKKNQQEETQDQPPTEAAPPTEVSRLICVKEAVMPGLGHFQPGDIITDPAMVERIGPNHPYFSADVPAEEAPSPEPKEEGN